MKRDNHARAEAQFLPLDENDREHARCGVELDVTVGSEHNFYAGLTENMSAGGVFVATHTQKETGELLEFNINLPNCDDPIRGVGEVVWVRVFRDGSRFPPGIGIKFVKLADGSQAMIDKFLESREPLFHED